MRMGVKPANKRVLVNILKQLLDAKKNTRVYPNVKREQATSYEAMQEGLKKQVKLTL